MSYSDEIVMNALDSNAFKSTNTAAGYINPTLWNREVLRHLEDTIIVSREAKVYDDLLNMPGSSLNVTINSAPTVAAAVAETAPVVIKAYAVTQVTFTPSEYFDAYQLTDKEARRGFYAVAQDMVAKIGYSLALLRDTTAITLLQTSAGNAVTANGVLSSAISSADRIDYADIVNAMTEIRKDKLVPKKVFLSPGQLGDLMKDSQFSYANQFGGRETILGGELKTIAGMTVAWSTLITATSSVSKGFMLGYDLSNVAPFGIARKALPTIRSERDELYRSTNFVGGEEYDFKILRANGVCTIETWDA